ncbi:SpoIIE family protein phosphatase [Streptomyces sp. SP18CS02]|uniref:SpoIIE family protein phosphatase n=1 Tax=Streptomyces sp. SP18CS02 TaxID=3002531 RepID=UPI002E76EE31|nr:SpoIIE family protein phosphatase [Streptomyces sp. SP18CS02]MEE1754647.1 SpoIIE family protein phosphatase [Streptomyces sp. SP18CS02]
MRSAGSEDPLDAEDVAALVLDGEGRVVRCTAGAGELLARPCDVLCGTPVRDLLAEPAGWTELVSRHGGDVWEGEAVLRRGDGSELGVAFRVVPLRPGSGEGPGSQCLVAGAPRDVVARRRHDYAFTRELFLQNRVGLAVFDENLKVVRTNTQLLPYTGMPEDPSGHRLEDFLQVEDAREIEEQLRGVLESGAPMVDREVLVRTLIDPREGRTLSMSAFRLQGADGRVMGVTSLFTDVTEQERARDRLRLLHRATAVLGGSLAVAEAAQDLADVLVPDLADMAALDIADFVFTGAPPGEGEGGRPDGREDGRPGAEALPGGGGVGGGSDGGEEARPGADEGSRPGGRRSRWAPMRRIATASALGGTPAATGRVVDVDVNEEPGSALWTGPGTIPAVSAPADAAGGAAVDEHLRSGMSVLLHAHGAVLGRVTVWRTGSRPPYERNDLSLLEEIASRAALVVENARRYARERRVAVSLQRSLLPPAVSDHSAVRTASVYRPTDAATGVSGDWFDVIPLSSARVALVVGDVVGHGLKATATMGRLRTAVRTLADLDLEPDELIAHLDDLVCQLVLEDRQEDIGTRDGGADGTEPLMEEEDPDLGWGAGAAVESTYDSFSATCLYLTYDPVTRRCVMASAGHPPPLVLCPDGTASYPDISPGPPLGVGGLPFERLDLRVDEGSVLGLFTDGLVEQGQADVDAGMAALRARLLAAAPLERPLPQVGREVVEALAPRRLVDDVTLLLARTRAVPPEDTATWVLEAKPEVVAEARRLLVEQLSAWGLDELVFTTELVASELVTNAIRYAGEGPIELRLVRAGSLICEVSDRSGTQPRMRRARTTEEGGRGLFLVAQLTSRWGSRYTPHGKTIWTEQILPSDSTHLPDKR